MSPLSIALFLIPLLGAAWFLVPYAHRRSEERRLARLCREARAIVLSYDDGPGTETTPRLLELLRTEGASATFFALGAPAVERRETVARLTSGTHELGSHTFEHTNAWKAWPWVAARDRERGIALIDEMGGEGRLFRPPFGKLTLAGLISAWARGLRLAWWTLDSRDSWQRRPIDDVLADIDRAGGGVVLMHDGDAYEKSGPGHTDYVVDLTRRIIEHARANGYRLMRLGDLLDGSAQA